MFYLLSFLLELFDGTLVDTAALVDQMAGGGRLARVDVANDDDVDVGLFLRHVEVRFLTDFQRKLRFGFDSETNCRKNRTGFKKTERDANNNSNFNGSQAKRYAEQYGRCCCEGGASKTCQYFICSTLVTLTFGEIFKG